MGYSGLENWNCSDNAAGWRGAMISSMVDTLKQTLRSQGNSYNTPGCVDVALILEDKTIFGKMDSLTRSYFADVAKKAKEQLKRLIEEINEGLKGPDKCPVSIINAKHHQKAYKRMTKSIDKFLEGTEEWL